MNYKELDAEIRRLAALASEHSRIRFARDTIQLLHDAARKAISEQLTEAEKIALVMVLTAVENDLYSEAHEQLHALNDSMCKDEVRAIEFHPDLTELLCAIDNLSDYMLGKDPNCIARIAINMVNSIDFAIGGVTPSYSIDNMLGVSEMQQEYERQKRILVAD